MSYEELIQKLEEYKISLAAKANAPSWFVTNIKTLLSKNITIEDWNSVQKYLRNNSSDIVTVDTMIQNIIDFLDSLKEEVITDTLIVKNIYKDEESTDAEVLSREEIIDEVLPTLDGRFAKVQGMEDYQLTIQVCESEPTEFEDNVFYIYPDNDIEELNKRIDESDVLIENLNTDVTRVLDDVDELINTTNSINSDLSQIYKDIEELKASVKDLQDNILGALEADY